MARRSAYTCSIKNNRSKSQIISLHQILLLYRHDQRYDQNRPLNQTDL